MGVFSKKEQVKRMENRINELEEEKAELEEVIRKLKENHALHVSQLKDKIKENEKNYQNELDQVRKEYMKWTEAHKGYNELLRQVNENFMIKDIELNEIMNKIMVK